MDWNGYGLFWCILEIMRNNENYTLELSKNTYRAIKILSATTIDVEKYIDDCINDYKLFILEENYFYSKSFLKRMQIKEEKTKAAKAKANARWNKKECNSNATAMQQQCSSNAIKEKKRKENEIKENKQQLDSCIDEVVEFYNNNIGLITEYSLVVLTEYRDLMRR